jgi:hypothetical protein
MKRMKYWLALCAALLIVFSAKPLLAATDITGTWVGDLSTQDGGTFPLKFNLKQDGSKVTGNVQSPDGDPLPISDGKIDGDKISFTVTYNGMVIHHEATISGDEIKVSSKTDNDQMPPMQFILKRSTDSAK